MKPVTPVPTVSPLTTAAQIIIDFLDLPPDIVRELSLAMARHNRRQFWIWQPGWGYWNKVVKHVQEWDTNWPETCSKKLKLPI